MEQPKNIGQLRDGLSMIFADVCNAHMEPKKAKEANNAAGKIIATLKVQLEAAALRKEKPEIAYLKG